MKKYLVIWRDDDEPQSALVSKEDFEADNWLPSYHGYKRLKELPNFIEFPSHSVFIMYGEVISK